MGLLHIYCGDGKGKTTAALGLALRASGAGMHVWILQFLKGNETSELEALKQLSHITVLRCDRNYGFTYSMGQEDKKDITECHNDMLKHAWMGMNEKRVDMLIFDEFNAAYAYGLLDTQLADRLVLGRTDAVELVLTGRNPHEKFVEAADYVSEIRAVKHPYAKGIQARKGIEY